MDNTIDRPRSPSASGPVLAADSNDDAPLRVKKQVDLFEHGRERALESGATDPQEAEVRALESFAEAIARETHGERYDPAANEHDAIRAAEHARVLKERVRLEEVSRFAAAELREKEKALGKLP